MKRFFAAIGAAVLACAMFAWPAFAADQVAVIDFTPTLQWIAGIVGAIITAVVPPLVWSFLKKHGIEIDDSTRSYVDDALNKAVAYGKAKVGKVKAGVKTDSQIVAAAANYAIKAVPDGLKRLGIDEKSLADMIMARLHLDNQYGAPLKISK